MRLLVAAVGLSLALGTTTASAQAPATSSWRHAAQASLAFGHAEGTFAAFRRITISSAPQSKQAADAVLDALDQRAQRAREAYLFVERYGSPFWTAAAQIRIGDAFLCQAEKIAAIPIPPPVAAAGQRLPPNLLAEYLGVLRGLVRPLEDQAGRSWERAAAGDDSSLVARRARERLAGVTAPDCS